jgi:hypothetical protein
MPRFHITLGIVFALLIGYVIGAKWPSGAQQLGLA